MQGHLARVFQETGARIVVYLVPTRALIAQVARDVADLFSGTESAGDCHRAPRRGSTAADASDIRDDLGSGAN
ncbi:hypothetical protein [Paracoccus aminovorans]|uniref:hypothetical protein n=1 Tax=Paracoccus aminovorans TaxID=34004 RepID=UPI00396F2E5E